MLCTEFHHYQLFIHDVRCNARVIISMFFHSCGQRAYKRWQKMFWTLLFVYESLNVLFGVWSVQCAQWITVRDPSLFWHLVSQLFSVAAWYSKYKKKAVLPFFFSWINASNLCPILNQLHNFIHSLSTALPSHCKRIIIHCQQTWWWFQKI